MNAREIGMWCLENNEHIILNLNIIIVYDINMRTRNWNEWMHWDLKLE